MRTIAIINQKGGCGKTTTAINLSAMLARAGKRTLLVDLDSQSHCAAGLGIPESRVDLDIGDAMLAAGHKPIDVARLLWQPAANFDLAPSRMRLAGLEASRGGLANLADKERRLEAAIDVIGVNHDIVCIDCSPSIGLLTYNALVAADVILIPVETSFFSMQGATRQVNTVKSLSRKLGIHRQVWILPTIHDPSNPVAMDLLDELYRRFGERVIPAVIRRDAKLREAASFGQR
jgi:chromosome partitioning protein